MNLVRWSPLHDMSLLQTQLNRLFENAMHGWPSEPNGLTNWMPPADIYETENDLVLTSDLPGIDPRKIDVRVENNVLTIRGERQFEHKVESENFHRVERSYGVFSRSFALSSPVDSNLINATYKDGVLKIALPKAESARPRKIQIAEAAA